MEINKKIIAEYQKKGFVIENGSVLCATSAFVNNFSALGRVFKCLKKGDQTKHVWEMVTEEDALKLATLVDPATGKKYIKFARIPIERVPQFNAFLPHEQEVVEEVEVSKSLFTKKPAAQAPVAPKEPVKVDDLDINDDVPSSDFVGDDQGDADEDETTVQDENTKALDELEKSAEPQNPATALERKELMAKTAKELHGLLTELGIEFKTSMKKEELVELILG
ncbi:hypothetical protein MASR1M48_17350 [Lactococcus petauri]